MADGRDLQLERFLPYRLNVLADEVSQSLSRVYADRYGIAIPEWRIIATLGQFETMTAKEIGGHSHMHKTKVSRAVTALAERGLIRRVPNQEDKREVLLSLTEAGRRMFDELAPLAVRYADRLADALTGEERRTFDAVLEKLRRRSRELSDDIAQGTPL